MQVNINTSVSANTEYNCTNLLRKIFVKHDAFTSLLISVKLKNDSMLKLRNVHVGTLASVM
jgi:hypothetical protein